jgi:hypothetical protein
VSRRACGPAAAASYTAAIEPDRPPSPPPASDRRLPLAWIVAVVLTVVVLGVAVAAFRPDHDMGTFDDPELAAAADPMCERELANLPPRASGRAAPEEQAAVVEEAAGIYERVAEQLRELPAEGADGEVLDAWTARWDDFTRLGRRYAAAIRTDDPLRREIGLEGDEVSRQLTAFAEDNDAPACAP